MRRCRKSPAALPPRRSGGFREHRSIRTGRRSPPFPRRRLRDPALAGGRCVRRWWRRWRQQSCAGRRDHPFVDGCGRHPCNARSRDGAGRHGHAADHDLGGRIAGGGRHAGGGHRSGTGRRGRHDHGACGIDDCDQHRRGDEQRVRDEHDDRRHDDQSGRHHDQHDHTVDRRHDDHRVDAGHRDIDRRRPRPPPRRSPRPSHPP